MACGQSSRIAQAVVPLLLVALDMQSTASLPPVPSPCPQIADIGGKVVEWYGGIVAARKVRGSARDQHITEGMEDVHASMMGTLRQLRDLLADPPTVRCNAPWEPLACSAMLVAVPAARAGCIQAMVAMLFSLAVQAVPM